MCNTPGFSGKKPVIEQPGVETFQRCFPQDPGKFCTLINRGDQDLIVQFETSALELSEANTLAVLQGVLLDGTKITGEDFVSVVP